MTTLVVPPHLGAGHRTLRWATASVPGRQHQRLLAPNQDAVLVREQDGLLIGVVADGCGSVATSGVAAQLLVTLFTSAVTRHAHIWRRNPALATALTEATLLAELRTTLATLAPGDPVGGVRQWALATLLGAVITPAWAAVVRAGDGISIVDGTICDPLPEQNAPAYLGYRLLDAAAPGLRLERVVDRQQFAGLLLATDGARPLLNAGADGSWAPLASWTRDDSCFQHEAMLSRRLRQLALERRAIDWEAERTTVWSPPLQDDTTVILIAPAADLRGAPA